MTRVIFGVTRKGARYLGWSLAVVFLLAAVALAGGGPRNVLVVENRTSPASVDITNYYVAARGIPRENICAITCSTAEIVSETQSRTIIAAIQAYLAGNPDVANRIDYIVLTKGVPLGANYAGITGPVSLTSVLTCMSLPNVITPIKNPYGPTANPRVERAFSHSDRYSVYVATPPPARWYDFYPYLVTRLDGFTVQDVYRMIDRSQIAAPTGSVALDRMVNPGSSYVAMNDQIRTANTILTGKGVPTIYDDSSLFMGGLTGLIGYFGWGSNDAYFSLTAYRSNAFLPGSIADTFVSTSGRTFAAPTSTGQSLIADLISQGCCGVSGYVAEPYTIFSTYPDVLFDRYTKGYNMAESFYMAAPELFWRATVVGDPLMAAYATRPYVAVAMPDAPLTGLSSLAATASALAGVSKVDFYFDNAFLGSATQPPFSVPIDTTQYTVGRHEIEAVATDASPIKAQGSTTASVTVVNPISMLSKISQAFPCQEGQGVHASSKVVTATIDEMGGELYIQEQNGTSGIRVICNEPLDEGAMVDVIGDMLTEDGERSIYAYSVIPSSYLLTPLAPIAMANKALGGGDLNPQTKGVTGGVGLRNVGLLVKTQGKVTYVGGAGECFFYIDDGSALDDGTGHTGVRVGSRTLTKPPLGSNVAVTGISSCTQAGENVIRLLKVRKQSDIVVVAQ